MNLILFDQRDSLGDGLICFRDQRLQQIRRVHRAAVGDRVRVGERNGLMGHGTITHLDAESVALRVELDQPPPPKLPLTLILALPRPKMLRRIVRSCAELGVPRIILLNCFKVEKSYWQSPVLSPTTLERYLLDGLQQARDTVLPEVEQARLFKPFVEDRLPQLIGTSRALVAHPDSPSPCPVTALAADNRPTTLVIGPEGGFTVYEVDKLVAAGCTAVQLGPRILRVENAVTTLISKLFA